MEPLPKNCYDDVEAADSDQVSSWNESGLEAIKNGKVQDFKHKIVQYQHTRSLFYYLPGVKEPGWEVLPQRAAMTLVFLVIKACFNFKLNASCACRIWEVTLYRYFTIFDSFLKKRKLHTMVRDDIWSHTSTDRIFL